ncbi:MAG: DUF447 family protein [Pirellulales bacterium]|nr:DUF447 family protein [Pirellulales bacterium]
MILEGIVTTTDPDGQAHVAPMGATIDDPRDRPIRHAILRPYRTSRTYANLVRTGEAVFHVSDDVGLFARAAVGRLDRLPKLRPAAAVKGWILADACRWYALRVRRISGPEERAQVEADVVEAGSIRDFLGFNRAMYAVVEGAILASRIGFVPGEQIRAELTRLAVIVEKTGGTRQREAWDFLQRYVREKIGEGK